jgi:hypothetical protein
MYPQTLQRYRVISFEGFFGSFFTAAFFTVFRTGAAVFFTGAFASDVFFFEIATDFFAGADLAGFFTPLFFGTGTAFAMILHHYGLPQLIREKYPHYWNNSGCRLLYIMDDAMYRGENRSPEVTSKITWIS